MREDLRVSWLHFGFDFGEVKKFFGVLKSGQGVQVAQPFDIQGRQRPALAAGLFEVASPAKNLQVGKVESGPALVDRDHVIDFAAAPAALLAKATVPASGLAANFAPGRR